MSATATIRFLLPLASTAPLCPTCNLFAQRTIQDWDTPGLVDGWEA
jgi:hypothetical protein